MDGLIKGLIGAGGASLLAWGAHSMTGADYVNGIESEAQASLAEGEFGGVTLSMQRDPLSRVVVLSGVTDPEERAPIEAHLRANSKVGAIRWADDAADRASGADNADAVTGASDAQVADCQGKIDAFMEGKSLTFRSGSAYLAPSSLAIIDGLGEKLSTCTGMRVAVGGHTDATGSDEVNQLVSQSRADVVAVALAERGIDAARITATGYGSSQPLDEGDGANAANRRIEFTLDAGFAAQEGE